VIRSFRHKGLADFFATGSARRIQPKHAKRLRLILTFEGKDAVEVDYGDYH
jgi:plasmid maintenance system killer protein